MNYHFSISCRALLLTAFLTVSCLLSAQTLLNKYQPNVTPEGAVYYLPKTIVRIAVQVEKTTYTPGDFCAYAHKYMKLNDVVQQPVTTYRVTTLSLTQEGVADTSRCYMVKFNSKSTGTNMTLADDGRLLAINAQPITIKAPTAFTPAPRQQQQQPRSLLNEEILSAGSTAKMAELTAQEIYDIRESKNQLLKGQADFMPKDGQQLRIMIDQLEHQNTLLTSMFSGTTIRDTTEHVFTYCPQRGIEREVLFRLSKHRGIVDRDDLSGVPFHICIEDEHNVPEPVATAPAKKKSKVGDDGIMVNIPGKIKITITKDQKMMGSFEIHAAQYGNTELLSGELFNRKMITHLQLNPTTGSIYKIDTEILK